jgi:replication factor C subunit 2/4|mmetsp:Transcript_19723/g.64383  ORF Transcript_19723/g.64383 Transcript_19723/m.64383 type:complete len:343 (+) Transcript_19723:153-1181(+)
MDALESPLSQIHEPASSRTEMWVEKYRPKNVKDVAAQEEVTKALLGAIEQGQLPHLLFYGPPGTGKTSTILAVTRMLYHPDVWRDRVLEMNASDERGIKIVRDKVKAFAQRSVGTAKHDGYISPPFKIIILDEADTMTKDAQGALRRTMETFSDVTRFCLVCNYVSRIIEPLASRCAKMRFAPLDAESMRDRLNVIATAENVTYREEVYKMILHCSKGDMRRAVTLLQSCVNFYGGGGGVMANALEEISGGVPTRLINALWTAVKKKDFDTMVTAVDNIMLEGFPALACLIKIHDDVLADSAMSDAHKAAVCEVIAQADKNLADGADDHLQLHDISARILHL